MKKHPQKGLCCDLSLPARAAPQHALKYLPKACWRGRTFRDSQPGSDHTRPPSLSPAAPPSPTRLHFGAHMQQQTRNQAKLYRQLSLDGKQPHPRFPPSTPRPPPRSFPSQSFRASARPSSAGLTPTTGKLSSTTSRRPGQGFSPHPRPFPTAPLYTAPGTLWVFCSPLETRGGAEDVGSVQVVGWARCQLTTRASTSHRRVGRWSGGSKTSKSDRHR